MLMTADQRPTTVTPEDLVPIRALYEDGLCLRAYELARALGPLTQWRGTDARILAGGLAAHLGSARLGTALHVRAWREAPTDPEACFYYTFALLVSARSAGDLGVPPRARAVPRGTGAGPR